MRVQAKNKNINGKLFINNKLKIQPMEDKEANSNTFKKILIPILNYTTS